MPRNTEVFEPTFKGTARRPQRRHHEGPALRAQSAVPRDAAGHLPVRSYLAVPVKGRAGDVIGGLFFGHSEPDRFTELHERLAVGIASVGVGGARECADVCGRSGGESDQGRIPRQLVARTAHAAQRDPRLRAHAASRASSGLSDTSKAIETIERNATSLTQIVEDVLDISRIVAGKIRLRCPTGRISRHRPKCASTP